MSEKPATAKTTGGAMFRGLKGINVDVNLAATV